MIQSLIRAATRTIAVPVLATAAIAATPTTAHAQFGSQAGFAEAFQPDFLSRDMPLMLENLRLEEWQRPIIEMLLDDYTMSFEAGVDAVKERMNSMKDVLLQADGQRAMELALQPIQEWEVEKEALRAAFIENVRSQLGPTQLERWPRLERAMRREKELPRGEIQGEATDLFLVLREMQLGRDLFDSLDPVLEGYAMRLDAALVRRRAVMDRAQPTIQDAMVSGDLSQGLQALSDIVEARIGVRTVNDDAIDGIAAALPDDLAGEFHDRAMTRAYPEIYHRTVVDRVLDQARELEDLTDEQRVQLDEIEAEYLVALEDMNLRMLVVYREHSPKIPRLRAENVIARRNGERVSRDVTPDAMKSVRGERDRMLEEYRKRILTVLSPDQAAGMPATRKMGARTKETRGESITRPAGVNSATGGGAFDGRGGGSGSRGGKDAGGRGHGTKNGSNNGLGTSSDRPERGTGKSKSGN